MEGAWHKCMTSNSLRRMSFLLWRRGKECGLRVYEDLTNRRLIHGHRPAISVVAVRSPARARQRESDFSRPHLLVRTHRRDQVVDVTRIRSLDGQMEPFQN